MESNDPIQLDDLKAVQRSLAAMDGDTEDLCVAVKRIRPLYLEIMGAANAVATTRYEVRDLRQAVTLLGLRSVRRIFKRYVTDLKKTLDKAILPEEPSRGTD